LVLSGGTKSFDPGPEGKKAIYGGDIKTVCNGGGFHNLGPLPFRV